MAAGKPLVAVVDAGSEPARVIEEHDTGWLVPPREAAALARVIAAAMAGPEDVRRKGANARRIAEQHFSRDMAIARYRAVIASDGGVVD
jgi:glycosyltransferase involved in cell wall biosynthesis